MLGVPWFNGVFTPGRNLLFLLKTVRIINFWTTTGSRAEASTNGILPKNSSRTATFSLFLPKM